MNLEITTARQESVMTEVRGKFNDGDIRGDGATPVSPRGLKGSGAGHGTVAVSEALLTRGRAVLIDGALPSLADALCMLGPPFGDGYSAVHRFIEIWERQPLARSFVARRALDDISVDDEDLRLLRDVLARDLTLAPESARAPIEEAIIQLDQALAWTLGGKAAMPLAGLAACHSYRVADPDERLLAAAAAIAFSAAGSPGHHGFPTHGVLPPPASSSGDVAPGFVSTMEGLLRAFADRHLKAFASSAAALAADETERSRTVTGEINVVLRDVPARLSFIDANTDGIATFAALLCPGPAAAIERSAVQRREQLRQDCRMWATQVMLSHSDALPFVEGLMALMSGLTVGNGFTVHGLNATLDSLDMLSRPDDPDDPLSVRCADIVSRIHFRLHLYAGHLGDPTVAASLAAWSAGYALMNMNRGGGWPMLVAALGWAERSAIAHPAALSSSRALGLPQVDDLLAESVASRLDTIAAGLAYALTTVRVVRDGDAGYGKCSFEALWLESVATNKEARRSAIARSEQASAMPAVDRDSIVVVHSIAEGKGYGTKDLHAEWLPWVKRSVPLAFTKDVQQAYRQLVAEAPHAKSIIDIILRDTASSRTVAWRPTMLVGKPGSGKTRQAVRICEELGVPHRIFACGGTSDSSFAGTSRQWSTGRPSIALQTIRQANTANVVIILDEVEKVALSRHNGALVDVLLAMLEPLNASRSFDLFLEGEVDLSRVLWLATANDPSMLHPALLDRFRILQMPEPRVEDLHAVLLGVVRTIAGRRGLSPEWVAPFDAVEMACIADLWRGGSIRRLARILEAVLDARDRAEIAN
jgi:hypothetical protein